MAWSDAARRASAEARRRNKGATKRYPHSLSAAVRASTFSPARVTRLRKQGRLGEVLEKSHTGLGRAYEVERVGKKYRLTRRYRKV